MTDGADDDLYDPSGRRRTAGRRGTTNESMSSEFQQAVDRLEQAVHDLVGSATSEISDRATAFLNDTTSRLEQELGGLKGPGGQSDAAARMQARRRARARERSERMLERSPRLTRDVENAKIVGVCAGIANYYGVEAWVVRCIAVTGLLFFGSIVFPAYWIMFFVMDSPSKDESSRREPRSRRRRGRRQSTSDRDAIEPLPELHRDSSPRRNLRNVQADLREVELRLRRMETHVTSGQYELQRELNKIDDQPAETASR